MKVTDPVCGMTIDLEKATAQEDHGGWAYFFCSQTCRRLFLAAPERYLANRASRASAAPPQSDS